LVCGIELSGFAAPGVAGADCVKGALLPPVDGCCDCANAIGDKTDAAAKSVPAATEVKSFPVIVNLPFILMGMPVETHAYQCEWSF